MLISVALRGSPGLSCTPQSVVVNRSEHARSYSPALRRIAQPLTFVGRNCTEPAVLCYPVIKNTVDWLGQYSLLANILCLYEALRHLGAAQLISQHMPCLPACLLACPA